MPWSGTSMLSDPPHVFKLRFRHFLITGSEHLSSFHSAIYDRYIVSESIPLAEIVQNGLYIHEDTVVPLQISDIVEEEGSFFDWNLQDLRQILSISYTQFSSIIDRIPGFLSDLNSIVLPLASVFSLNNQQNEFVERVSTQSSQFLYILFGTVGTGKSYTLAVLKTRLQSKIFFMAPTGKAAVNLGFECYTIHSIFPCVTGINKEPGEREKSSLRERFSTVEIIVIEEYSMLGVDLLGRINYSLVKAFSSEGLPFAGRSVILTGDLQQLLPVRAKPIWATIQQEDSKLEQDGKRLFTRFTNNFHLTTVMRQSGEDQKQFREVLSRIGQGEIIKDDFLFLKKRFLSFPGCLVIQ